MDLDRNKYNMAYVLGCGCGILLLLQKATRIRSVC